MKQLILCNRLVDRLRADDPREDAKPYYWDIVWEVTWGSKQQKEATRKTVFLLESLGLVYGV